MQHFQAYSLFNSLLQKSTRQIRTPRLHKTKPSTMYTPLAIALYLILEELFARLVARLGQPIRLAIFLMVFPRFPGH